LHNQIFELCYYGNGFNQSEVYKLPVHLRNFYYKKLADAKKVENDSMKKQSNSAGKPKTPSKVRVNR
jgi:hypothetical protein